jgi:hypothetical protein
MHSSLTAEDIRLIFRDDAPELVLPFLASRSKQSARQLSAPASEVFKGIRDAVDQLLLSAIETRTEDEFQKAFSLAFPKYMGITLSLSAFARVMVPSETINRMARESICELEAEFREKALTAFGKDVRDQLLFTAWTLRKVSDLLTQISAAKATDREHDKEYCEGFTTNALRAKFCMDCLTMALHLNRPIYPGVMEGLKDGLRAMVNAYTWARRGAALRVPSVEAQDQPIAWDDEEEELLRSSMHDMTFMTDTE